MRERIPVIGHEQEWASSVIRSYGVFGNPQKEVECVEEVVELIQQVKLELWNLIVCPLCYRLNPHHAHERKGKGCNWCQEKYYSTGQTLGESLNEGMLSKQIL